MVFNNPKPCLLPLNGDVSIEDYFRYLLKKLQDPGSNERGRGGGGFGRHCVEMVLTQSLYQEYEL